MELIYGMRTLLKWKRNVSQNIRVYYHMRQSDKELKGYLKGFATLMGRNKSVANNDYYYKSLYHFAVKEMQYYKPAHLTSAEKSIVMRAIKSLGFKPQVRQCFYNSQMLALNDDTNAIRYVEGYGKNLIPTLHGWCEINKKVIDVTWKEDGQYVLGQFNDERSYAGVIFPTEYCAASMLKNGFCGTLIEDYKNDYPIMKKKWDGKIKVMNVKH